MGREAVRSRVNVLSGDASNPNAGLGPDVARGLRERIGLVLNCAGLVEFFAPVDLSLRANVDSVERLVELCGALEAKLLHVSTCYVAGEADGLIEETDPIRGFYPRRPSPGDHGFDADTELAEVRAAASAAAAGLSGAQRADAPHRTRACPGGPLGLGKHIHLLEEPRRTDHCRPECSAPTRSSARQSSRAL